MLEEWKTPPVDLTLSYGEVHVWRAALDVPAVPLQSLECVLCKGEAHRACRFRLARDRRRYIATRGTLRLLLGRYLEADPAEVRFVYGEQGKPALAAQTGEGCLCFNVAHSGDLALWSFARDREVGVDLEQVRAIPQMEQIAKHFFSAREYAELQRVDPSQRVGAFYACWTRKEAYVKARGAGLALPLDSFSVSLAPGEPARLVGVSPSLPGDGGELDRWSFWALTPAPGYVGAVAVEGAVCALDRWQVPGLFHERLVRERVSQARADLDTSRQRQVSVPLTPMESTR
jgi:4'-phosphopantetheinyl transferase